MCSSWSCLTVRTPGNGSTWRPSCTASMENYWDCERTSASRSTISSSGTSFFTNHTVVQLQHFSTHQSKSIGSRPAVFMCHAVSFFSLVYCDRWRLRGTFPENCAVCPFWFTLLSSLLQESKNTHTSVSTALQFPFSVYLQPCMHPEDHIPVVTTRVTHDC